MKGRGTWEQDGLLVRRCSKCMEVKPLEAGFYVADSKATGMARWRYWCRACDNARSVAYKRQGMASPVSRAKYARWKREWVKRNPERHRAAQRRYKERVKADPKKHAAFLESERIAYRLRQERNGRGLDQIRKQRAQLPAVSEGEFGRLPALPLARTIEAAAQRRGFNEDEVCNLVGVSPRNVFAWRSGERSHVQFDVADRVLTALELSWWDVWDGNDPAVRAVWEGQVAA